MITRVSTKGKTAVLIGTERAPFVSARTSKITLPVERERKRKRKREIKTLFA